MTEQDIIQRINAARLLPVVVLERAEDAVPLAKALLAGGLDVAEVTFRTAAAKDSIHAIAQAVPEILLGAGTVTNVDQLDAAAEAGATFIVTPGFNPDVVRHAQSKGIPIVPGINNPTGVEQAMSHGLKVVKFFPAGPTGGVPFLKALTGPYGDMRFVPTGGVNAGNVSDYLGISQVVACGGSWMVDPKLIAAGKFDEIRNLTAAALSAARAA
ncbi:bifunctional 4-hydroxy-2-oxoglutarate aldolase/2-dehydro-3-deoxy-phosphogluconate aldolase [Ruegeria atlantica]|uniref:bifunctional 4-hydroxy-2-oxoglutarate aldolase/2-dehydro-3-deoxy-phosphogluconate aldolase n=1 Tax=Ruegeria atlantica TaxID=81569 RepID=UPI001C2C6D94